MDWDAVRIFLAVARAGALRGAAQSLGVSHATVARGLNGLETQLDARLFDRSRAGFALTQSGEDLLEAAEEMERAAMGAERRVAGRNAQPAGVVRVSAPPLLGLRFLAPLLAEFARAQPEIEIDLQLSNEFLDLTRWEADVSIRLAKSVDDDVVGRRLIQYRKTVYAAPEYFADRPDLAVGDGEEAGWIGWGDIEPKPAWVRASPYPNARLAHAIPEAAMQIEAAAAGMGLTYLPCFVGDADPRLTRAPGVEPVDDRSFWLLMHRDLRETARIRVFVDFMAEAILARRAEIRGERHPS